MLEPIVDHTPLIIHFKSVKVEEKTDIFTVKSKLVKTTCFTGVECKGAIRQGLKIGDIAMAGVPMGTKVRIIETGKVYTVATRPDNKTFIDIFYGNTQEDYEACLRRGVKYYSYEVL